ncbi:MAG: cyclodeaminase/cyclohydrolase family protein [Candidatus Omnitrophica bacterium]|nr:cyclodeaminase/cyclohydrolase family protein [Candidatus Omnitrophota bacterium]
MDYNYLKESLEKYIEQVSAKTPCPGGGSVSILSIALANALILMVCNFSVESKKIKEESRKISREVFNKASEIQTVLNRSIEEDSAVYQAIQDAMKNLKKNSEKTDEYKDALIRSINLHMKMLEYCQNMLEWNFQLMEHSNPYLLSDIGVSSSLIEGAARSTRINILVNLCEIDDQIYISNIISKLEEISLPLIEKTKEITSKIENKIMMEKNY